MNFPEIPPSKKYSGDMTPEQKAMFKLVNHQTLNGWDEAALMEAIVFYEQVYSFLKDIDLAAISKAEVSKVIDFLNIVLNFKLFVQNNIHFKNVYRVSFVRDEFLEDGKVRDIRFISYPPRKVVQKTGRYGRANSSQSTCFYCAFNPTIALLETKPSIGDRIIISQWHKNDDAPFVSFPIINNDTVKNEGLEKGTKAFRERMQYNHPLFARILDLLTNFLSSEFIKDSPIVNANAYEYLYSAFFADKILESTIDPVSHSTEPLNNFDCIVYPSIAAQHRTDNLAIRPSSLTRLRPMHLKEIVVTETDYANIEIYDNESRENVGLPIHGEQVRTSNSIINGRILWDDDN